MAPGTRFTELVGCELPLQLAAMGGVGTTELAAAVAAAGGCGMVPAGTEPASGACGVNFLMPFDPSPQQIGEASASCPLVEFFYADPRPEPVEAAHRAGAVAGWQVGSAAEAAAAAESGCDYVVAQGVEAGGHVRATRPLDETLESVLAAVQVPVVAAGGVATAERFAELMQSGADAVRVGTAFVVCPEAGAHPDYVQALLEAGEGDTVLTEWFGEGWEEAPHRVLRAALDEGERSGWRGPLPPLPGVDRSTADMAMYAGTGVGSIDTVRRAGETVAELVSLL